MQRKVLPNHRGKKGLAEHSGGGGHVSKAEEAGSHSRPYSLSRHVAAALGVFQGYVRIILGMVVTRWEASRKVVSKPERSGAVCQVGRAACCKKCISSCGALWRATHAILIKIRVESLLHSPSSRWWRSSHHVSTSYPGAYSCSCTLHSNVLVDVSIPFVAVSPLQVAVVVNLSRFLSVFDLWPMFLFPPPPLGMLQGRCLSFRMGAANFEELCAFGEHVYFEEEVERALAKPNAILVGLPSKRGRSCPLSFSPPHSLSRPRLACIAGTSLE